MKLKYEIERTTDIDVAVINLNIMSVLKSKKYKTHYQLNNTVEFYSPTTGFRGSWEPSQLSEGNFKLDGIGDGLKVKLTYYISFTMQIVIAVIWLLVSLFTWNYIFCVLVVGVVIFTFIDCVNLRIKANELIEEVVSSSV